MRQEDGSREKYQHFFDEMDKDGSKTIECEGLPSFPEAILVKPQVDRVYGLLLIQESLGSSSKEETSILLTRVLRT